MKICGTILAILYAAIMIFAIIKGKKKSISSVFIAVGSLLVLAYSVMNLCLHHPAIALSAVGITGMAAISIGALINGIQQKQIHISHHIIRLVIEAAIIALCVVGSL